MCRYFVMFKGLVNFSKWAALGANGYHKKCKVLSSGMAQVGKNYFSMQKSIPAYMCTDVLPGIHPGAEMVFYHTRIPFDEKDDRVVLENIHPFTFDQDRYIAMHNGLINFKKNYQKHITDNYKMQIQGTTDSEQFFALWLSLSEKEGLEAGFEKALTYVKEDSTMNLVLYDRVMNELYIYRSKVMHKLVPPVYVSDYGFSNFKVPGGKTISKGKLMMVKPST